MKTFFCLLFLPFTLAAQTNTSSAIQNGAADVKALKQLFAKKKTAKKDSVSATTSTNGINAANAANGTAAPGIPASNNNPNIYQIGKLAPNAKVIDCDHMYPFNLGAAIIQKGQSYALIDPAGNFIVPWNKYSSISMFLGSATNGIFEAHDAHSNTFYINSSGKVLYDVTANWHACPNPRMSPSGNFIILEPSLTPQQNAMNPVPDLIHTIIDRNGKKYLVSMPFRSGVQLQDSMVIISKAPPGASQVLFGFKGLDNSTIVRPSFDMLSEFCHGVAIFGVKDQFGQFKYGIINKKGKIILPPSLPIIPEFLSGLSDIGILGRTANSDYLQALINMQSGRIIYKNTQQERSKGNSFTPRTNTCYASGIVNGQNALIDSAGNITLLADLLHSIGIKIGPSEKYRSATDLSSLVSFGSHLLCFSLTPNKELGIGPTVIYDTRNGHVYIGDHILSGDVDVKAPFAFDPVAHLAIVSVPTGGKNNYGNPVYNVGYMNEQGEMIMVKSQPQ